MRKGFQKNKEYKCIDIKTINGVLLPIGLVGDLNPDTYKLLKAYFPVQADFEKITKDGDGFIIEIDYSDYREKGHEHKYFVGYNKKEDNFYITDEFEIETGKSQDVTFRKFF